MYTEFGGATKYVANPTNPEAKKTLARMQYRQPPPLATKLRMPTAITLGVLAIAAAVTGMVIPEQWWQDEGVNDLLGWCGFIALVIVAGGCWHSWLEDASTAYFTERRFYQLRREGAIISVPFRVYYYLEERLSKINLKTYATRSYQLQPADFNAIREIADAEARGIPGAQAGAGVGKHPSEEDRKMQDKINRLLDEIAERIHRAFEDDVSERNGRLEGLGAPRQLEEG